MGDELAVLSCEPFTIWALEKHERPEAVIALVKECASQFRTVVGQGKPDSDAAQDCAIGALAAIAGLFSPSDDEVQELLTSLMGVFMGAKAGRTDHILLQRTDSIPGIKKGFGQTNVAGFAIAAMKLLTERRLLSARAARQKVASWLADAGLSLRNGDHAEPILITDAAVRHWYDNPATFRISHGIAAVMTDIFAANLAVRNASTLDEISVYLRDQASEAVRRSRSQ